MNKTTVIALLTSLVLLATGMSYFDFSGQSQPFLAQDPLLARFNSWKSKYNKSYGDSEHQDRFEIFK